MFSTRSGAVKLALGVVIGLITLKVLVAIITGSISISAQAVDSFLDLLAITIIFLAISVANRPADEEHPFGHGKMEGIAAIVQGGADSDGRWLDNLCRRAQDNSRHHTKADRSRHRGNAGFHNNQHLPFPPLT
ncbi:MAG: cation transporter [Chloroflexi bacterium]|nr:cation transporter [Chloroflexota bacterium]